MPKGLETMGLVTSGRSTLTRSSCRPSLGRVRPEREIIAVRAGACRCHGLADRSILVGALSQQCPLGHEILPGHHFCTVCGRAAQPVTEAVVDRIARDPRAVSDGGFPAIAASSASRPRWMRWVALALVPVAAVGAILVWRSRRDSTTLSSQPLCKAASDFELAAAPLSHPSDAGAAWLEDASRRLPGASARLVRFAPPSEHQDAVVLVKEFKGKATVLGAAAYDPDAVEPRDLMFGVAAGAAKAGDRLSSAVKQRCGTGIAYYPDDLSAFSPPPGASQAAPSTPTTLSTTPPPARSTQLILTASGLGVTQFGDTKATVLSKLASLGPPASDEALTYTCPHGENRALRWRRLTVFFADNAFEGFSFSGAADNTLRTAEGVGLGDTTSRLKAVYGDQVGFRNDPGEATFFVGIESASAPGLRGTLSGKASSDKITEIDGGDVCTPPEYGD
jgi:hypothetical protein